MIRTFSLFSGAVFALLALFSQVTTAAPVVRDITLQLDPTRSGLGAYSITWGDNLLFDKNGDGHKDILLSYHISKGWEIWLSDGAGNYSYDSALAKDDRHNCKAADFGTPGGGGPDDVIDLVCVIGASVGTSNDKENELLVQKPDGTFVNEATARGLIDTSGRGRVVEVLDIRGDGIPSLYIGNKKGIEFPSVDRIFEYNGTEFEQVAAGGVPSEQNSICSSTGDFNRDGRQDFLSCSFRLRLYQNTTAAGWAVAYKENALGHGIPNQAYRDAELADLNSDGWPDFIGVMSNRLEVRLNRRVAPYFSKLSYRLPLQNANSVCLGLANGGTVPDMLIVQGTESLSQKIQSPDKMLLNLGAGNDFKVVPVPQPPQKNGRNGIGDTCTSIPNYFNGRSAWVINNGKPDHKLPIEQRSGYRQVVLLRNE